VDVERREIDLFLVPEPAPEQPVRRRAKARKKRS